MMATTILSVITCPYCNHGSEEQMPANACQFFYECRNSSKTKARRLLRLLFLRLGPLSADPTR
jgi:hypothetical protein